MPEFVWNKEKVRKILDYISVPEAGMGYVLCPKCKEPITQKKVEKIIIQKLILIYNGKK